MDFLLINDVMWLKDKSEIISKCFSLICWCCFGLSVGGDIGVNNEVCFGFDVGVIMSS